MVDIRAAGLKQQHHETEPVGDLDDELFTQTDDTTSRNELGVRISHIPIYKPAPADSDQDHYRFTVLNIGDYNR